MLDAKPTADGLRVKATVENPEGGEYDIRVEYEYTPKGVSESKYGFVPLKGQGTDYSGEATLPIPQDATDVTVQAGVHSALLGEYVYGDFVAVASEPAAK